MKIYIVYPKYDIGIDEIFTERHLAEEYRQGLDDPMVYYIEEKDLLDHVPKGGNRYERLKLERIKSWMKDSCLEFKDLGYDEKYQSLEDLEKDLLDELLLDILEDKIRRRS